MITSINTKVLDLGKILKGEVYNDRKDRWIILLDDLKISVIIVYRDKSFNIFLDDLSNSMYIEFKESFWYEIGYNGPFGKPLAEYILININNYLNQL